jgi:hypothetical protein
MLLFLAIVAFPLLSEAQVYKKVIFAATMAGWMGSYPLSRIRGAYFERILFIMFLPIRTKRWSLDRFVSIQPEAEPVDEMAGAWWWIFGNWYIMWIVFDWMIPWVGGPIKLWLRSGSGKRVLAWQGRSDSQFRENLQLLQHRLGLSIAA